MSLLMMAGLGSAGGILADGPDFGSVAESSWMCTNCISLRSSFMSMPSISPCIDNLSLGCTWVCAFANC